MISINMVGGGFQHLISTNGIPTKYLKWDKSGQSSVSIHIDYSVKSTPNKNKKNFAWLCEAKTIHPDLYSWVESNIKFIEDNYIYLFTHDLYLSSLSEKFKLVQCSAKSFISENEHKLYPKNKIVSMFASTKRFCKEHLYRQEIAKKYRNKCDLYGTGRNFIQNKIDGLKDYCFSITMENATYPNMFSEKITDCFVVGTVPIYYGISNIGDFFDERGIIILNDEFDIDLLSFDLYFSMEKHIKENFRIASNLLLSEDYIFINHIQNILDDSEF